jgi:hypothetical protein
MGALRSGQRLRQRPVVRVLAYGGDRSEQRDECRVLLWNRIKDFDWAG